MSDSQTTANYGASIITKKIPIKFGRKWWQFWKPWQVAYLSPNEMQTYINLRTMQFLKKL